MTATKTETLAANCETTYGMSWESRLVRLGDKYFVVHDDLCGMSSLEGEMYRPYVYGVPSERVPEIREYYERAGEGCDELNPTLTYWSMFKHKVLPSLHCYGLKAQLRWAANL